VAIFEASLKYEIVPVQPLLEASKRANAMSISASVAQLSFLLYFPALSIEGNTSVTSNRNFDQRCRIKLTNSPVHTVGSQARVSGAEIVVCIIIEFIESLLVVCIECEQHSISHSFGNCIVLFDDVSISLHRSLSSK